MPVDLKPMIQEISGMNLPQQVGSCLDYNCGDCTLAFSHPPKKKGEVIKQLMHICCLCLNMFGSANFHRGNLLLCCTRIDLKN